MHALFLIYATLVSQCHGFPQSFASEARISPPSGCLTVRQATTKAGEYSSIGAAVAALGSGTSAKCIFIYGGTYHEQVVIKYGGSLTMYGYTDNIQTYKDNAVTISYNNSAAASGSDPGSATVNLLSPNIAVYNINFANTFGQGSQALAMAAQATMQGFYGCSFTGYQDTLLAGYGSQYYKKCYIQGAVDFIFGYAAAWFGDCVIASIGAGYVTASGRGSDDFTWYVIDNSEVTAASGHSLTDQVYLGRPWGKLARVIFQYSTLSDEINAAGWHPMTANATPIFEEYQNTGAGSITVARLYETMATSAMTKPLLWPNNHTWYDTAY